MLQMRAHLSVVLLAHCFLGASAADWYDFDYEKDFVEALMLIVFIVIAIAFETFWHRLSHTSDHTYKYGDLQRVGHDDEHLKDNHGHLSHRKLWEELSSRVAGEFMSLGFLAFCIFVFNQLQGFELMANRTPSGGDFKLPQKDEDWLHTAEFVHMQLFVGMLLYFGLVCALVHGSVEQIRSWEALRLLRVKNLASGETEDNGESQRLKDFCLWRRYFVARVSQWRQKRPELFAELISLMGVSAESKDFDQQFEERLAFSAYLAVNLERNVCDSIEVNLATWLALMAIFMVTSIANRFLRVGLLQMTPIFISVAFGNLLGVRALLQRAERQLVNYMAGLSGDGRERSFGKRAVPAVLSHFNQRHSTELILARFMQGSLFILSYLFARNLLNFDAWAVLHPMIIVSSLLFSVLFFFLAVFLGGQLPIFFALFSLPPNESSENVKVFFAVLQDEHALPDAVRSMERAVSPEPYGFRTSFAELVASAKETRDGLPRRVLGKSRTMEYQQRSRLMAHGCVGGL